MKLYKLKSIFLLSALAISIFFTGCSNDDKNLITNQTQIKNSSSNNNQIITEPKNSYKEYSFSKEVPKNSVKAILERVVDGDTMKLKLDETGEIITLRLLLVDTPESVKKGVDPQPYSIEASNFTKSTLLSGDTVYIEYDEGDKTDKYGRHLGYLWFYSNDDCNWQMFNEKLISEGYARVGYIYSQKRYLNKLYKAQDYAKLNKLNIWSVEGYVTNKGFDVDAYNLNSRKSNTENNLNNSSLKTDNVYANSNSKKYHSNKNAHNIKDSIEMTEEEAKNKGYQPCSLCY